MVIEINKKNAVELPIMTWQCCKGRVTHPHTVTKHVFSGKKKYHAACKQQLREQNHVKFLHLNVIDSADFIQCVNGHGMTTKLGENNVIYVVCDPTLPAYTFWSTTRNVVAWSPESKAASSHADGCHVKGSLSA